MGAAIESDLCSNPLMVAAERFFSILVSWSVIFLWALTLVASGQLATPPGVPSPHESQVVARTPEDFAEARKLAQVGKVDEAIAKLQALAARDPAMKGLALELGAAYYKKSAYPEAIRVFQEGNSGGPGKPGSHAVARSCVLPERARGRCDPATGEGTELVFADQRRRRICPG